MSKFTARIAVVGLSALVAATSVGAAQAMNIAPRMSATQTSDVQQVQWRDHRRWDDRGWHHHHHGGNAGAIIGGLAAGAILGGALEANRPHYYYDRGPYYYDRGPYYYHRGYYYGGY